MFGYRHFGTGSELIVCVIQVFSAKLEVLLTSYPVAGRDFVLVRHTLGAGHQILISINFKVFCLEFKQLYIPFQGFVVRRYKEKNITSNRSLTVW